VLLLQGEVQPAASLKAARTIRSRGKPVLLNPAPVHEITAELLEMATILVPNEVEARALLGDATVTDDTGVAAAEGLRTADRVAVVTLGARGAAFAGTDGSGAVAPPKVQAVDSTGAGDSFCAALGFAFTEGAATLDAVRFACAAGAHAASVRGAEPGLPTRSEVEALLATPADA
jgi:ribokinase